MPRRFVWIGVLSRYSYLRCRGEVRGRDHRAAFVALRQDLEEEVGLLAAHRQIADLVDDQQPIRIDPARHELAIAVLMLHRLQHQQQIGGAEEASLVALPGWRVAELESRGWPCPRPKVRGRPRS